MAGKVVCGLVLKLKEPLLEKRKDNARTAVPHGRNLHDHEFLLQKQASRGASEFTCECSQRIQILSEKIHTLSPATHRF